MFPAFKLWRKMAARASFKEVSNNSDIMSKLMFASAVPGANDPLKNVDLSYFHHWIPQTICHDAELQGRIVKVWDSILREFESADGKNITIRVENQSIRLFQLLLKTYPHVKFVFGDESGTLRITFRKQPSPDTDALKLPTTPCPLAFSAADSLDPVSSSSNRFINPSIFHATPNYLDKLLEISNKIKDAINNQQSNTTVPCLGYDRIFFKRALCQLYPSLIRLVLPEPGDLCGGLYISFKANPKITDAFTETISRIQSFTKKSQAGPLDLATQSDPAIDLSTFFKTTPTTTSSAPLLGYEHKMHRDLATQHVLIATYLASIIQNEMKGQLPKEDDVDSWTIAWRKFFQSPILLRTLAEQVQQALYARTKPLTEEQQQRLSELASVIDIKKFKIAFDSLEEELIEELKLAIDEPCHFYLIRLFLEFNAHSTNLERKIFERLAYEKCLIEMASFKVHTPISIDNLKAIPMEQVNRSYFPSASPLPLVSIRINGSPFEIDLTEVPREARPAIYYQRLIETLCFLSKDQHIDGSSLAEDLIKNREFRLPPSENLALMLRAASFSSWAYLDMPLRQKIAAPLAAAGYTIKFVQPQENPTCEFFVSRNEDFTTIRTGVYEISKDGTKKGEFVAKWIVSLRDRRLLSDAKISMIDITGADSVEEQELIYRSFAIPR